jgi:hypothetical protein
MLLGKSAVLELLGALMSAREEDCGFQRLAKRRTTMAGHGISDNSQEVVIEKPVLSERQHRPV